MPPIPITSYSSYVHYWEALAHQNCLLNGSFYVGDSWRIIGAQRSRILYPALWLERPVIETGLAPDGDSLSATLRGALSIVGGVATDDWKGQEERLQQCNRITSQIIARLKRDADLNYFDLEFPILREPLATVLADDLYGWRIEFNMEVRHWAECFDEGNWVALDYNGTTYDGIGFWKLEEHVVQ